MLRRTLAGFLLLLLAPPAVAQSLRATYEVHALGSTLLELEARFDFTAQAYRIETTMRTRGLAAAVVPAQQASRAEGVWVGNAPAPSGYASEGTWRGNARRIVLGWQNREPRVMELVPPNEDDDREPVSDALRRGTVDVLSAFAGLVRRVGQAGDCDMTANVFDGRRRSDFATRTEGRELIRPWRGAWQGEALRCAYEGRQVAGFRRDQDRAEAVQPQRGTAWIAAPYAGAPPIPVRLDIPTRWFGTATAVLLRAEPLERRAELGR